MLTNVATENMHMGRSIEFCHTFPIHLAIKARDFKLAAVGRWLAVNIRFRLILYNLHWTLWNFCSQKAR